MEIFIIGLIIVALMVYTSTRIKRSAASAFEPETIETDDFILVKPEGFLHLINGDPAYAFQAYSKDFGTDELGEKRQAQIDLRVLTDATFEAVCEDAETSGKVIADGHFLRDQLRSRSLETEQDKDGVETIDHYLMIDAPKGVYEMRTVVLKEHNGDYLRKIGEVEDSLTIKK